MATSLANLYGGSTGGSNRPRIQYTNKSAQWAFVRRERNNVTGVFTEHLQLLSEGTEFLIDWGNIWAGPVRFKPYDMVKLLPLPGLAVDRMQLMGKIDQYCEKVDPSYTTGHRYLIYVQDQGLGELTSTSVLVLTALRDLHQAYEYAREATEDKLQSYIIKQSLAVPIASRNGEIHNKPVLEPSGRWFQRDEAIFGPRVVPVPSPILAATKADSMLSPPAAPANGNTAPDPFAALATPVVTPDNENGPPPAADPFAAASRPTITRGRAPF